MTEFSVPVDFLVVDFREKKASCIHISKKNAECMRPRFFMLFFCYFALFLLKLIRQPAFTVSFSTGVSGAMCRSICLISLPRM